MSPSVNHSYICTKIIEHLLKKEGIQPFVELILDIDKGMTPDISVYRENSVRPDFLEDKTRCDIIPLLAIEILSPAQVIQELVDKAKTLLAAGVSTVWIVDTYARTVIVVNNEKKETFHREPADSEGIKVDFREVFI